MLSEFWLEGCCAGSSEFLLPLDSTPAYFTHFAAFAAAGVRPAELAETATAAIVTASVTGSRAFTGFVMRRPFLEHIARPRRRAWAGQSYPAPVGRGRPGHAGGWNSSIV